MENTITSNRAVILMYENTSEALNKIADHIEQKGYSVFEAINLLRESAI